MKNYNSGTIRNFSKPGTAKRDESGTKTQGLCLSAFWVKSNEIGLAYAKKLMVFINTEGKKLYC